MLHTVPCEDADPEFLFDVYAGTRRAEVADWGWDPAEQEIFLRMQFTLQRRAYAMQYPGAVRMVIRSDDTPVGTLMVHRTAGEIRLVDISVLPQFRNAGIGTSLIHELQREAASSGKPLTLHVAVDNPAARLYGRMGFVVTGETSTHLAMRWQNDVGEATI